MYGRNAQYKRESMAIMATITSIEAQKDLLDDKGCWPAWMSDKSLWLFAPAHKCACLALPACLAGLCAACLTAWLAWMSDKSL